MYSEDKHPLVQEKCTFQQKAKGYTFGVFHFDDLIEWILRSKREVESTYIEEIS